MSFSVSRSALLLATALLLASTGASADVTKDECVDANSKAQLLRREAKLSAAREQFEICIDKSCPHIVRMDCIQRLDELESAQATIVFDVRDAAGNELRDVKVAVDGRPLADKLDGSPLAVDPGPHPFTFELQGQTPGFAVPPGGGVRWVTQRFIIHEGEKGRQERVVVSALARSTGTGSTTPAPFVATAAEATPESVPGGGRRTLGIVLGATGIAGIAVGGVFGLLANLSWNASKSECSSLATSDCNDTATCPIDPALPNCPNHSGAVSDHDAAVTEGAVSTVGFIAGGALLGSGIALWLTAPSERGNAPTSAVSTMRITPSIGTKAVVIDVKGKF